MGPFQLGTFCDSVICRGMFLSGDIPSTLGHAPASPARGDPASAGSSDWAISRAPLRLERGSSQRDNTKPQGGRGRKLLRNSQSSGTGCEEAETRERGQAAAAMATAGGPEGREPGCEPGCEQGCEHYRRGCRLRVGERGRAVAGAVPRSVPRSMPCPCLPRRRAAGSCTRAGCATTAPRSTSWTGSGCPRCSAPAAASCRRWGRAGGTALGHPEHPSPAPAGLAGLWPGGVSGRLGLSSRKRFFTWRVTRHWDSGHGPQSWQRARGI